MSVNICGDELEKEIILIEQELNFKRKLLDECRAKLNLEISQHAQTKLTVNKYVSENKELLAQLNVCLNGTQKLEEENRKNREFLVKLQVQFNAYLTERQQLLDNCYRVEKENNMLKNEVAELKEQLKGHVTLMNNYEKRKSKTEALIFQIIEKQEILNKEQAQLKHICNEGLRFAEKLSEEAKFQIKYVQEAKNGQIKTENEIIRLMAAITELKAKKERSDSEKIERGNPEYIEIWKSQQKEMMLRNTALIEINQKLQEELNFTREQVEMLMKITERNDLAVEHCCNDT